MRRQRAALALVAALAACGGDDEASIRVEPSMSLADEPVRITATGLEPRGLVSVRLRSTDGAGVEWTSSATFRADAGGRLDLDRHAPLSGSYAGAAGSGLIWSLRPGAARSGVYRWREQSAMTFSLAAAVAGEPVASATFQRQLGPGTYRIGRAEVATQGFDGVYFAPTDRTPRPGILLIGGSGGGIPFLPDALLLAARGYPVLALAYFGGEGLPRTLSRIPLEYFERAATWLAEQPEVGQDRVVAWGISRGSEAALLLGVHYPRRFAAVVAVVPSNVALCSFPGCDAPAWTLRGRALPFTRQFDEPAPTDDPRAVIPVERIRGPLFLVCGRRDRVWRSCAYARAIAARRPRSSRLFAYERAGHALATLAPYQPLVGTDPQTHEDEQRARAEVWPHVLEFLEGIGR